MGRPKAGQETLSRERILSVALQMIDEQGMKGFSLRRLAAELAVDPMAIYYHLPNKQAILAGLVERVFAGLRLPPASLQSWPERLRAVARAYHSLARAHPHLVLYLVTDRASAAVAALDLNEALYEVLVEAGLSPQMIVRASDLVVDYVNGFALAEVSGSAGQPDEWRELRELLDGQPSERFPALHYVFGNFTGEEWGDSFEAGLDIIVAGIAAAAKV
jgi:AcrR family transcriptional regulator